ncbi:ferric iron reductase FhuF-like transporter family protein [Vibrio owensii]|uniref:(2Fe-2S)-binding protein n=1 Tax=Vibrio owensii TaxID=696485 RepID=UPI000EFD0BE6|nr:IucA/IucC family C-terminal-domain containing protein [Vibrio owensii]AYO20341.1 ferric iron reductase FhuF-like transporter family protein [Vibrio owensii]
MENLFNQFRTLVALPENVKTLSISDQQAILNRHEPFFRLRFVEQPTGIKASEWFERDFPVVVQDYADSIEAKLPFAVPIWQKVFNAILLTSLVGHRVVFDRVLQLTLDDLYLTIGEDHRVASIEVSSATPFFALESDSDAMQVESELALDEKLAQVITTLSEPLVPLYKKQKVSPKVFWGNALYACDLAFSKLAHQPLANDRLDLDVQAASKWQQNLFNAVTPKGGELNAVKKVTFNGFQKLYVRRETCCLKYKIEGKEKCSTCNLHDSEIQENIMRNKLLSAIA